MIVLPALMQVMREQKGAKIAQMGERVFGVVESDLDHRIDRTIEAVEAFFRSLGLSTRLSEEGIGEATIAEIERRFTERGVGHGERGNIDGKMTRQILERAL